MSDWDDCAHCERKDEEIDRLKDKMEAMKTRIELLEEELEKTHRRHAEQFDGALTAEKKLVAATRCSCDDCEARYRAEAGTSKGRL